MGTYNQSLILVGLCLRWKKWVIDSGCTNHMTGEREMLVDFVDSLKASSSISFGDNSKGKVLGLGKVNL